MSLPLSQEAIVAKSEAEYGKGYGSGPFGSREVVFGPFRMNPVVSLLGFATLWAFVIYVSVGDEAAVAEKKLGFKEAQTWVTEVFTWLYIASQDYWLLYLIPLVYHYGHIKLGRDDDEPEYSDVSYFAMVFCAGVAIGLIFYGASEPLYHLKGGPNRYNSNGYSHENEQIQNALNVTIFHWGVQAWVVYAIVAVSMGFMSYRQGLPLSFRSTLAPLFGKATWGWFGDLLDVLTIATIVAGLCTSLGLGASQILAGLMRLGVVDADSNEEEQTNVMSYICAAITIFATASVVCGLDYGIKTVSQTAFIMGNFLLVVVFCLDEPWYLLNVIVQSFGWHVQHFIEISFFTDAFSQLGPGQGGPNDGLGAASAWMDWWTIFYWGWWISWAPFVGTFMARISKGRTIRNVVAYTLTVPFFYALVWFCVFGGAALRMNRRAEYLETAGLVVFNDTAHFVADDIGFRPAASSGRCFQVPESINLGDIDRTAYNELYETNTLVSPVCAFVYSDAQGYWFDLMNQYHGMGEFLSWVSVITTILYFVTSSDSGSLVVDLIAGNGQHPHVLQRVVWAFSEGAVCIALLRAGGSDALTSLQAISIVMGLPFTIVLMLVCSALWRALKIEAGHMKPINERTDWTLPLYGGIFDVIETVLSLCKAPMPSRSSIVNFVLGTFVPPLLLNRTVTGLGRYSSNDSEAQSKAMQIMTVAAATVFFLLFIVFHIMEVVFSGFFAYAWFCYIAFAILLAVQRHAVRKVYQIEGSGPEDFFASLLLYPQVLAQMVEQLTEAPAKASPKDEAMAAILGSSSAVEAIIVQKAPEQPKQEVEI